MCSTPKSSSATKLKKVPTSQLTKGELNNFVSVANASAERQEEKELLERQFLARESLSITAASASTVSNGAVGCEVKQQESGLFDRLLHSVHCALSDTRSWGMTG